LDQPITLKALYADSDSADKVTFFLDTDANPLNGNAKALGTITAKAASDPHSITMDTKISGISAGLYYVASKIFDLRRARAIQLQSIADRSGGDGLC
jgi:hypothetical protein